MSSGAACSHRTVFALAWIAVRNIDRQRSRSKRLRSMISIAAALGHWQQLLLALPLYLAGTVIRICDEEALLREQFGEDTRVMCAKSPRSFR